MKITLSCGQILSLARRLKRCLAAGLLLASGLGVAQAQVSYSGADDTQYVQNFTSLPVSGSITWANNSTVPGWYARCQSSSPVPTTCLTSPTNASNTVFSYGPSGATAGTPRALGMYAASSTGNPTLAVRIRNNTGRTLTSFRYQFVGQQWRSDETHKETMNFSYQLATSNNTVPANPLTTSGTWSTANVYYAISIGTYGFFSQNMSASGNIDGTNPANQDRYCSATVTNISWANGQDLWLSWTGNSNYYQGLGIANFSFSASDVDAGVAQYRQTAFDELAHTDDQISGGGAEPREVARAAYYALALDTNPTPGDASVERSEGYMTTVLNAIGPNGIFPGSIGGANQTSTGENNFVDVPLGIIFTRYHQYLDSSFVAYATPILESAVTAQDNSTEYGCGYTNMFCSQSTGQLLLGQALNDSASAYAGAHNFQTLLHYTTQQGIYQEYDSSNYAEISYVDMLAAYNNTTNSTCKAQLLTMLQYYATDFAATYFPGRQVLAGAQSRDYDRPGNQWENVDDFYYLEGFSSNAQPQIGYNGIGLMEYCNDYVEGGFTVQNNAAWAMNIPPTTGGNVITERIDFNSTTGAPIGADRYTYITPGYALGSSSYCYGTNNEADAQITADLAGSLGMGRVTVLFGDQDGGGLLGNYASTVQSQNFLLSLNNLQSYSQAFNDVDYNIDFPLSVDAMYYCSSASGSTIQVVNNPASVGQGTIYPPNTAAPLSTDAVVAIRKGNNVIAYRMFQVDGIAGNTPSPAYIKFDGGSNMGRLVVYAYPVQTGTPTTVNTNPMARVGIVMAATTLTGTGTQDAQAEAFLTSMLNMTFNSSMNGTVWNVYTSLNHVWLNASLDTNRSAANNCVVNREVDSAGYIPDRFTVDNGTTATDYATQILGPVIATPTNFTAKPSNAQVALSWNTVSGAANYNVYRSTTSGGPYTTLGSGLTTASYTDTSAANGTTYYYVVTAWIPAGESPQSAQVGATPEAPPAAPTGLTVTPGNGNVALSWTAATNAASYNVYRSTSSNGTYTLIGTTNTTSYTDNTAANGTTYYYKIAGVDVGGTGVSSTQISAKPLAPPAAPTGLSATPGNAQVALTWTAATNAASYNIGRATTSGGPYTTIGTATTTTYTDTTLTNGTTYYYVVSGVDVGGTGANSAQVSATPLAPPAAPTGVTAAPGNAQFTVSWTASTNAASYNVKRATTSGGPYTTVGTTATTSYTDSTTANGTTYYYVVSGVDVGGEGANSAEVNGTPLAPPAAPTGVNATPGNAQVMVTWAAATNAASYNIKRATTSGGLYTTVGTATTTSYDDTTAVNGTTYYYVVSGVDVGGEGFNSAEVNATPLAPPPAPAGLGAAPGNAQVVLTWAPSTNAAGYNIKRATTSGGPYTTVGTAATTSYTDATTANGTTYFYVVSAVDVGGESANSSEVNATPLAPPAAPTGVSGAPGNADVVLSWNAATNAASYNVYRSTSSGGTYTLVGTTTTTSYNDTTAANGTTYYYKIAGVDVGGTGVSSTQISATPLAPPAAPTGFSATPGNAQVALTWTAATNAASYNIGRATTSGGPYTTVGTATTATYTDTTVTNGTTYYYVVSGVDVGGTGANSAQASATPLAPPAAPTGFSASPGNAQVGLTWTAATNAASYNIGRATTSGGPYTTIGTATTTSYTDTTPTNGTTYYYVVAGVDIGGTGANSAEVSATPLAPPAAPTGFSATPGNAQVMLTWSAATNAASYNIGRATTSGGPYTTIGTATTTSYNDTTVTNGTTYYYVVAGVDVGGTGANSAQVSATSLAPPAAPGGISATAGNSYVLVSWTASTNAASYNIGRATISGGPYTTIGTATTTSYTDTTAANGTTYYYVVAGIDVGGTGANSAQASATPLAPPAPPAALGATPGNAQVALTWTAATNATSYNIGRATTSGGPYTTIGTATTTSYNDTTVTNGTTYYYVVAGVDVGGAGANSGEVSATPLAPPAAPGGFSASPGTAQVALTWTAATNAASYNIGRATTSGGPYSTIGTATTTSYNDTTTTNGTTYYYVVSGVDVGGTGANSAEVNATPLAPPAAPTALSASPGNAQVALSWTAATNAANYNIGRATTSGGSYTTIGTATTTNYNDTTTTNGTTYYYVVSGVDVGGTGANSAQVSATPLAPPAAPTGFIATPGNAQVALNWTASTNAASYNIGRATTSGGPYTTIGTATTTSYNDTTVTNGTTYYYVVSGVDIGGTGANSAQASAKPTGSGLIGPVGYWPFSEGTGTATADASGKGINGTLSSSTMWTTSGKFGDALTFNGTSNTVSLNDASTTSALKPTLPVTVSVWIKLGSTSGTQTIFASDAWNSTYAGYNLQLIGGVLECSYGDGGNAASGNRRTKTGTTVLSTGVWYHVAATIQSATSMNLYVNGVDNGGTYSGTGGTMVYTTAPSTISGSGGADYFNGTIDDVRVYNRSLSSTEVGLLAKPPVSEWRFGEGTGTTANDSGTAGIAGTLSSSTMWTTDGKFGDALILNGTSSYLSLNDASSTSALKPAFPVSVSAWIYLSSTSGTQTIFASDEWDTTKNAGYNVMVSGGLLNCSYGNAQAGNGPANRYTYTGTTVLNTGQWYYVTAVIANATTINLYVNGVADTGSSSGTATTMGYTTTASEIGAASAANVFAGVLDDVRVYNYALSATQVGTLNNAASGVIPPE